MSFCTRQLPISPTQSSFSLRQSIALTRAEFLQQLAGSAELADELAVEIHLVDLAVDVDVRRAGLSSTRRGTGAGPGVMQMRARRADVQELRLEVAVAVEHLDAPVAAVGDVDDALRVDRDARGRC